MATIHNYLLFNHTYLQQLQADGSVDEQAVHAAQGVREWYPFRDNTSTQTLVQSWVEPLLNSLELELRPLSPTDARAHLLCTAWDRETPVGLCYVTPPGADLDTTTKGQHWMAQAVLAARNWRPAPSTSEKPEAEDKERHGLRWVILTNGGRWRLLDAQALRRYEAYLQVDLDELVRNPGDLSALRVFYRCFHRSAFERDKEGRCGLDRLLEASEHATKRAEDHLKARVSANEGIMARLCLGLVQALGKSRFTEAERDAIYRDATYLLYRLLFILYAEARGLLPMDNPAYRQASLTGSLETARTYKLSGVPDHNATTLWERLQRLCAAIYESDPALGIPAYNGGLFDDADKPHLRGGQIPDGYLADALFDLAYQPDGNGEGGYRAIDYRDLSVRHLGSLYEGMIEYRLQIAEETLWARREGKGNVRFLRSGQDGAPRKTDSEIKPGQVYFSQSPGERRATGTYYTPEYIVDYIVSQTVWRGLSERRESLQARLKGWLEEMAVALSPDERARMERTADEELVRFVEEQVLTFRVCDPAMGSGHFLVNAAHQMTAFIVETLHLMRWENVAVDADPIMWRRRVVERCLYGVDLSLMAVELGKLSLWLASVAGSKPLSFLDHHIRQGNSLIGAWLDDLAQVLVRAAPQSQRERKAREAGQLTMLDDPAFSRHMSIATDLVTQISARVAETVEDVRAQEADYEKMRDELTPYRRLADLWVGRNLGVYADDQQLRRIAKHLLDGAADLRREDEYLLIQSEELANQQHSFHWELEFTEPFFCSRDNPWATRRGFDAVIGNPPYVDSETMTNSLPELRSYCTECWASASGNWDLFVVFIELGIRLARQLGRSGLIVPNKLLGAEYCIAIQALLRSLVIESIRDYSRVRVFEEAAVYPIVYTVKKDRPSNRHAIQLTEMARTESCEALVRREFCIPEGVLERLPSGYWWPVFSPYIGILVKCLNTGRDLGQLAQVLGAATVSEAYELSDLIEEEPDFGEIRQAYFRFINTGTIDRYASAWGVAPTNYLKRRLERPIVREEALAHAFPTRYRQAKTPKIILAGMVQQLEAYYDRCGTILAGKSTVIVQHAVLDLAYIMAIVNSRLCSLLYRELFGALALQGGYLRVGPPQIARLPIHQIERTTPLDMVDRLAREGQQLYAQGANSGNPGHVLRFVKDQLTQEPRRDDILHDLLVHLAREMIELNERRLRREQELDLFRVVERNTSCLPLDKSLGGRLVAGERVERLSAVRHDIEALRLSREAGGCWLLAIQAKLRDPATGWREYQRDPGDNVVREWLPAYRLTLDEPTGRFYHYAFQNLSGFEGFGRFPGGSTRTTLEKLLATKVPKFVPVDLAPLEATEADLADVRRRIQLTDDLIDQIVYRLYGLTEEEVAMMEGRAGKENT